MNPLAETAFAKINLALHVRHRRDDGYHELETLFVFAADGDVLRGAPAKSLTLAVEGPFARALATTDLADNLVLHAAARLRAAFGVTAGAALTLDKRLPVASGIGGGSADAAAALRLLTRMWRLPADAAALSQIAAELGADVPACLGSWPVRGDGRGDRLTRLDGEGLGGLPLLLVNPGVALSTSAVFAGWDGIDRGPLGRGEPLTAALAGRNDLERPARKLAPAIDAVLAALAQTPGARLARMSGSGATCFALFDRASDCDSAAAQIAGAHPAWWLLASRLR